MPALLRVEAPPHLPEDARRAPAGKLPQALPLHGGCISMGKASPAERLLHSRGDGRDWAVEVCRDVSHAVKCCHRLLALLHAPAEAVSGHGVLPLP